MLVHSSVPATSEVLSNAYVVRPSHADRSGFRPYVRQYSGRRVPITLADLPSAVRHFDATFGGE